MTFLVSALYVLEQKFQHLACLSALAYTESFRSGVYGMERVLILIILVIALLVA